jgi:hypothetical protein
VYCRCCEGKQRKLLPSRKRHILHDGTTSVTLISWRGGCRRKVEGDYFLFWFSSPFLVDDNYGWELKHA